MIDTSSNTIIATVPVGNGPTGVAITSSGSFAYVVNTDDNNVSGVDISSNNVITTIPVGTQPNDIAMIPNGNFAYVTNGSSGNVSIYYTSI